MTDPTPVLTDAALDAIAPTLAATTANVKGLVKLLRESREAGRQLRARVDAAEAKVAILEAADYEVLTAGGPSAKRRLAAYQRLYGAAKKLLAGRHADDCGDTPGITTAGPCGCRTRELDIAIADVDQHTVDKEAANA